MNLKYFLHPQFSREKERRSSIRCKIHYPTQQVEFPLAKQEGQDATHFGRLSMFFDSTDVSGLRSGGWNPLDAMLESVGCNVGKGK